MMDPLISVIVPAYNAEKWIEDCCRSVMSQTYRNWELIVINDGSQDGTAAIVTRIASEDTRIQLISTVNCGVCHARNIGLDTAKGEWISFLDADDMLFSNALELLYGTIAQRNYDMAIGWKTECTQDGIEKGCPYPKERAEWSGTEALKMSLLDHPATYAVWGKLYKRALVSDIRFIEGRHVHEDSFFVFQCMMKCPAVVLIEDCVLKYRISDNSASRSGFSEKMLDILYFSEQKTLLVQDQYPELIALTENMIIKSRMALLHNLCKTWDRRYKQLEKESLRIVRKKRKSFAPATIADQKWFWIIRCHMYGIYKIYYLAKETVRIYGAT